jgi:hypothetical protein
MICPFCQGQRLVRVQGKPQPCEECGGKGEIHCCEGLQAQPEGTHRNECDKTTAQESHEVEGTGVTGT